MRNAFSFAQTRLIITVLFCSIITQAWAQRSYWRSYTFSTAKKDSVGFNYQEDTTITQLHTPFSYGLTQGVAQLQQDTPRQNTNERGLFTLRRAAALDLKLEQYPMRTSVKIKLNRADTPHISCSGIMISRRHVITAAHEFHQDEPDSFYAYTSVEVCPAFDQGNPNKLFGCAKVKKVHVLKNWDSKWKNIAVLELEKDLGDKTGWVGVSYDVDLPSVRNSIYYRFTYPYRGLLPRDRNQFNGDTMYYSYGYASYIDENSLGVNGRIATYGDGGSALIKVENNKVYSVYGTLSWSGGLKHTKPDQEIFRGIEHLIKNHLTIDSLPEQPRLAIFPNPTTDRVRLEGFSEIQVSQIQVTDLAGKEVLVLHTPSNIEEIDLDRLPNGVYHLRIDTDQGLFSEKIIKSSH